MKPRSSKPFILSDIVFQFQGNWVQVGDMPWERNRCWKIIKLKPNHEQFRNCISHCDSI